MTYYIGSPRSHRFFDASAMHGSVALQSVPNRNRSLCFVSPTSQMQRAGMGKRTTIPYTSVFRGTTQNHAQCA